MQKETATVYKSISGRRYFTKKRCLIADCKFAVKRKYGHEFDHKNEWIFCEETVSIYNRLLSFVLRHNGIEMRLWDKQEYIDITPCY